MHTVCDLDCRPKAQGFSPVLQYRIEKQDVICFIRVPWRREGGRAGGRTFCLIVQSSFSGALGSTPGATGIRCLANRYVLRTLSRFSGEQVPRESFPLSIRAAITLSWFCADFLMV